MGLQGFGASPLWMKSRLGLGGREGDKKMRGSQRDGEGSSRMLTEDGLCMENERECLYHAAHYENLAQLIVKFLW